ncbi:Zinc-containing alcohol dehydrogenase superfamily [Propionibacterium freudenreichii subsp. freudenreichii]|nr:Zinc-containing alcohol dehydrogenase superfamily [Propionibacterium freudenreichii]CEP27730.1 Zinc-containing alcohol dehydrogenase superfamily [Propionibacterium freudenreichii subsp. freudenreichii]CUW19103.1 GroES-like protein [Propionibacterium freudenreichii subsp. shermanii]CEG99441.1 Zinc-containing alcohol dehydrogenase superfamily [Propionibacterium freudenreichii]CEH04654.1 Zinc-containing alcohol dehydrogenase superfamily [Propionibacterium freudenreichii]
MDMTQSLTTFEIPATMRAAVLREPGAGLKVETIRTPHPKEGEILLKVAACGLCHSDLHVISGAIAFPTPAVLGHEVAGTIVELGPGNEFTGLQVGQQAAGAFLMPCGKCAECARGHDELCLNFFNMNRLKGELYDGETRLFTTDGEPLAMYSMGGLAEYAVIPSTAVAPVPANIDTVPSAILGCAALTGYGAVRRGADLRYGETVAVVAVGGVGTNIVQVAHAMGARQVIAIDVSDEKLAPMAGYGATATINSTTHDPREEVLKLTGGRGVDVAFEALGIPATWQTALDVIADGGRMVPIGLGGGVQTAGVEINRTVRRSQSILGSYGARTRQDLPAVIDMASRGIIDYKDVVSRRFTLEQANEGYELLAHGGIQGRGVVDMSL